MKKKKSQSNAQERSPVVVIMGHVDHGKTSILDYVRKSKVAEQESGGITQHIGAYQAEHKGKIITFIDTPGHEAFYAMRSRGAKVADIAVLVVAADDGVMPQTKEAIKHIKKAGIPMIVAINKIDKQNADPMRVKNQLLEDEIVLEEFKGDVPSNDVSATTGQGMDDMLDTINLVAEVEELKADPEGPAQGLIVEAELNDRRGAIATLLVKEGTLRVGDIVATSSTFGKIKILENFMGEPLESAGPSTPALVVGLADVPQVGEKFVVLGTLEEAEIRVAEKKKKFGKEREVLDVHEDMRVVNIVLKADVAGSLEAIHEVLRGIQNEEVAFRMLEESVGDIAESDIKLAATANAVVVGFRTKMSQQSVNFAQQMKVDFVMRDVIYELVEAVRAKVTELLSSKVEEVEIGEMKILAIFRTEKSRMIVGGKVTEGEIKKGVKVRVHRNDEIVGEGRVIQVKIQDKIVGRVEKGKECGILLDGHVKILIGDILKAYEKVETKIQL